MGIKERKQRDRITMQRLILKTASSLFQEHGIEQVSIRNIAASIEYSPATIYLYFRDKNEILFYLRNDFMEEFEEKLREFDFIKDHYSRLKNISQSWLEYAINNPDKYQMIFSSNGKLEDISVYKYLDESITACIHNNQLHRMPISEGSTIILSFLHGMASLVINNKLVKSSKPELKDYLVDLVNRFLTNMKGYSLV